MDKFAFLFFVLSVFCVSPLIYAAEGTLGSGMDVPVVQLDSASEFQNNEPIDDEKEPVVDSLFALANHYYIEGNYEDALEGYQELLTMGYLCPVLYYNLGNAYFKTNRIAQSVWAYEQALLLNPAASDVQYNLALVNAHLKDQITVLPSFFLSRWYHDLLRAKGSNFWAMAALFSFFFMMGLLYLYFSSHRFIITRTAFFSSFFFGVLASLFIYFSFSQKNAVEQAPYAILFEPVVHVKSAPSGSATDLFVLHEGAKVEVLSEVQSYSLIRIADGNQGWVPTSYLQEIGF